MRHVSLLPCPVQLRHWSTLTRCQLLSIASVLQHHHSLPSICIYGGQWLACICVVCSCHTSSDAAHCPAVDKHNVCSNERRAVWHTTSCLMRSRVQDRLSPAAGLRHHYVLWLGGTCESWRGVLSECCEAYTVDYTAQANPALTLLSDLSMNVHTSCCVSVLLDRHGQAGLISDGSGDRLQICWSWEAQWFDST